MKITATKAQVIKAMKKEPLFAGSWVDSDAPMRTKNKIGCAVCAVGGVLEMCMKRPDAMDIDSIASHVVRDGRAFTSKRSVYDSHGNVDYVRYSLKELKNLAAQYIADGEPLTALSSLFEALADDEKYVNQDGTANRKMREILVNFVKSNFPKKVIIDTTKGKSL